MNYIIFNADGSVNKQDFDYYIQQGSVGDTFFISKESIVSQAGLTAVAIFTLPNGTTNTVAGVWGVKEIEGQNYVGYTFTLGSAQTLYNGLIPVSIMISSSVLNTTLLTYPVALVINETGVLPSTDTGITIQEINSYLAQLRNYQEKYTLENVRYYQAEPTNAEINKLAENQVVFVNTGINHDIVSIYQKTNNVLQQVFNLDLGNNKIVNLANPTNNGDAMNKQYADSHYASKTSVSVSKTASNNAITIDLRTGTGSLWVETATLTPATSSDAGLLSASDKVAIDTTIPASVSASGHSLDLNSTTYVLSLKDANGNVLNSVDLPLESLITNMEYVDTPEHPKSIKITLQNGTITYVPVGDLVSGLAQDNAVVHKTGNETITGTKTFTDNAGLSTKVNENGVEVIDSGAGHTAKYLNNGIIYDNNSYSYPDASGKLLTEEKANLQKYAEKDGDYPLLTAGKADVADNLKLETEVNSTTPYKFDMVGNSGSLDVESGNTAHLEKIQGVSVVFNQLFQKADTSQTTTVSGITITDNQDGSYTINGTATGTASFPLGKSISGIYGHKYLLKGAYGGSASTYNLDFFGQYDLGSGVIATPPLTAGAYIQFNFYSGTTFDNLKIIPQVVDYTLMFGNNSRIPTEFLSGKTEYGLDGSFTRTVSVAGIFNRYFPETYYAYNTGTLIHTQLNGELVSVGKNAFDKDHPNDYIKVIPEQVYASSVASKIEEYDNDKNLIKNTFNDITYILLSPNTHYVKITWALASANNYFQLRHTGNYLGYKAYEKKTNQLPIIARLSGLWGVSGDEYTQKGVSTSRYGFYTFTGNEGFNSYANERFYTPFFSQQVKIPEGDALPNVLCNAYITTNRSDILTDKTITVAANGNLNFRDTGFSTVADFVEFITGKTIIFELATPTTDTNEQWAEFFYVDDSGTTEFSQTTGNFAPVGQKTYFQANASDMIINTASTLTTKGGLSANNTWTGTNTFTNKVYFSSNGHPNIQGSGDTITIDGYGSSGKIYIKSPMLPSYDNTTDIGSSTNKWKDLYSSGTANVGKLKIGNTELTEAQLIHTIGTTNTDASSTTVSIASMDYNKDYIYETALTSLTITAFASSTGFPIWSINFKVGSSFTASFPNSISWLNGTPIFEANKTYTIVFKKTLDSKILGAVMEY